MKIRKLSGTQYRKLQWLKYGREKKKLDDERDEKLLQETENIFKEQDDIISNIFKK